ncbi:hypothetical protein NEOLEDRAFT_13572 [Neolentinus lepideus HHB14362 ss-1]|uniref:Uncharacterized protein n=1 Tax=Neolentinus lepideus HHB14362 ss-1 TaxID=1314782 RepID=A0A165W120_9AGAM|nr:hypothetical protein NEOLEDRAFT_13572 [Neolentinus lepideus HHB14362 ss-1]
MSLPPPCSRISAYFASFYAPCVRLIMTQGCGCGRPVLCLMQSRPRERALSRRGSQRTRKLPPGAWPRGGCAPFCFLSRRSPRLPNAARIEARLGLACVRSVLLRFAHSWALLAALGLRRRFPAARRADVGIARLRTRAERLLPCVFLTRLENLEDLVWTLVPQSLRETSAASISKTTATI